MIYEKPKITFQKFHTDAFLDDLDPLSANDPGRGWDPFEPFSPWSEDEEFTPFGTNDVFNGTISINSDGVGGWFNG